MNIEPLPDGPEVPADSSEANVFATPSGRYPRRKRGLPAAGMDDSPQGSGRKAPRLGFPSDARDQPIALATVSMIPMNSVPTHEKRSSSARTDFM
jgi:hypothetical protein